MGEEGCGSRYPTSSFIICYNQTSRKVRHFLTLEYESKGLKIVAKNNRNEEGGGRIEYGCFGCLNTQKFGNISPSFSIDLLKTRKLKMPN